MEKSFVQIIPEGNKNTCYVGLLLHEEDAKIVCDEACDDIWLMVKHELPMLEDIQVLQPHKKKNMYLVTKVVLPYSMIEIEDIMALSEAILDAEKAIIDTIKPLGVLNYNAKRIKGIFKDFPESEKPSNQKPTEKTFRRKKEDSRPICALLTEVGINRTGTSVLIHDTTGIDVEEAARKFARIANGTSQYEFLYIFQNSNEANNFTKAMEDLGNKVILKE